MTYDDTVDLARELIEVCREPRKVAAAHNV
jgi:hypothetical protein